MKFLKYFGKTALIIFGLLMIFIIISSVNHNYKLRKESKLYPAPGELIEVNDNKMHIYSEGEGNITLVFMSGFSTSSPTLDFKPLWSKMTDDYRIAVVERSGYGWSETSSSSRDIDTILEETRKLLKLSGEHAPYVLIPHSMSGLEAIYWSQKYPNEVKAIIGLDPAIPEIYLENSDIIPQKNQLYATYFISRIGLTRFMDKSDLEKNIPLLKSNESSEEDKEELIAIFYRSAVTKNMLDEVGYIESNAKKVKDKGIPINTPIYFFISDGSEIVFPNWRKQLSSYVSKVNIGEYMYLGSEHYVHYSSSDTIANEIKKFLEEISK